MKLNVFGMIVKVKRVKNLSDKEGVCGDYSHKSKVIRVDKDLKGKELIVTELHEFIHSVMDRLGVGNAQLSHDLEEIICDGVATALAENTDIKWKKGS